MAVPPDFVAGQVLTAAQMNKIGLWLIKTQTIGSAVSSVAVTGAFSADYQNYWILISGGSGTTTLNLNMTLGATTTGYYYAGWNSSMVLDSLTASRAQNAASFVAAGTATTSRIMGNVLLYSPFEADETVAVYSNQTTVTTGSSYALNGFLNNTTSYTDFTLTTSTGTVTGGTIYVYGFRD